MKKRVLVISPYLPADGISGGCTQLGSLLKAIGATHEVDWVCYDLPAMPETGRASARKLFGRFAREAVVVPFHGRWRDNRFSLRPEDLPVYSTPEMEAAVSRASARGHDVVLAEFECMAPYARVARGGKKFLTIHELSSLARWRRAARGGISQRPFNAAEAVRSLAWECANLRGLDGLFTFNPVEARFLRLFFPRTRVSMIPIAVGPGPVSRRVAKSQIPNPKSQIVYDMVFLGNFTHPPNSDALLFLLSDILPRLPGRSLLVIGGGMSPALERMAKTTSGVTLAGQSRDPQRLIGSARVAVAPLRLGGGARLKVIEALAAGVPVVSTPVGAEGVRVAPEEGLVVKDTAAAFSAGVEALLADPAGAGRLGRAGRDAVRKAHSIEALRASIMNAWAYEKA